MEAMKLWMKLGAVSAIGLAIPTMLYADWFGIGTAVAAGAEASWKIYLVKTVASIMPLIILLASIIGTVVCAYMAGTLALKFGDVARDILRDNKVADRELWVMGGLGVLGLPVIIGLLSFGFFLGYSSIDGLSELMK